MPYLTVNEDIVYDKRKFKRGTTFSANNWWCNQAKETHPEVFTPATTAERKKAKPIPVQMEE